MQSALSANTALVPAEGAHATLSASGCYRWWACTASPKFEATFPEKAASVYALEGTAAHSLAQACLATGPDGALPDDFIGQTFDGFEVTEEMAEAVQVYVELCRGYMRMPGAQWLIEQRLNLAAINPPVPMFGTADFVCLLTEQRLVVNVDYKHGKGIAVEAQGNPQPKYYALGVLLGFPDIRIDTVEVIIVQPRTPGQAVKRAVYDSVEILGWSVDLIAKAYETQGPDAKFVPGSHCRFCKANGQCPAQAQQSLAVAQIEFDDAADFNTKIEPPPFEHLTPAQIGALLEKADTLDTFIDGLRATAQRMAENGEDIPGWKLVPRRATRKWANPDEAPAQLAALHVPEAEMWTRKFVSPAQAEKKLTALIRQTGSRAAEAERAAKTLLAELIVSVSPGTALAPDDDTRPKIPARGTEFDFENLPMASPRPVLPGGGTEFDFEKYLPAS